MDQLFPNRFGWARERALWTLEAPGMPYANEEKSRPNSGKESRFSYRKRLRHRWLTPQSVRTKACEYTLKLWNRLTRFPGSSRGWELSKPNATEKLDAAQWQRPAATYEQSGELCKVPTGLGS